MEESRRKGRGVMKNYESSTSVRKLFSEKRSGIVGFFVASEWNKGVTVPSAESVARILQ